MSEYSWVNTGKHRAMVIQARIGGGWNKVADTRSEYKARELADGLNDLRQSDGLNDLRHSSEIWASELKTP